MLRFVGVNFSVMFTKFGHLESVMLTFLVFSLFFLYLFFFFFFFLFIFLVLIQRQVKTDHLFFTSKRCPTTKFVFFDNLSLVSFWLMSQGTKEIYTGLLLQSFSLTFFSCKLALIIFIIPKV